MFGNKGTVWRGRSEFTEYEVAEEQYNQRPARLLFSGKREAVQSGLALDKRAELLFDYNQRFLELCSTLSPQHALLIGGGAMTLPTAVLIANKHMKLDVVERDPLLVSIAQQYFNFLPNPRLKLYHGDGRAFLDTAQQTYDLLLVDAFSQLSVPTTLSTVEAVRAMKAALRPDGHIAVNIVSPYYGRSANVIRQQLAAYAEVFVNVQVYAADATDSGWIIQNLVLIATDSLALVDFRSDPLAPLDLQHDAPLHDL